MDEILKIILQNTLVNKKTISKYTRDPINNEELPKRTFYVLLRKYADDFLKSGNEPRMVGLAGLPGTGKTTLMWQIAEYVYNTHKVPIYFFNVNVISTNDYTLYQILQAFQTEILKKKFTELTSPIVLLFDEVHDDPNWAKTLKILYDEARKAFIVCTGSPALLRQQTADLARRMKIEKVFPFRFIEFVAAKSFYFYEGKKTKYPEKNLSADLKNALFFSSTVDEAYHQLEQVKDKVKSYFDSINQTFNIKQDVIKNLTAEYIKYNNIPGYILYKEKTTILEGVLSLLESVIYQDIPKLKKGSDYTAEKIKRLLFQLAISDVINPDTLSQKTGIKKDDLENVLDIMDKAELLNILSTYGEAEAKIWKNKKAFFMSPSLRFALLAKIYRNPEKHTSKLYEDIVVMYLRKTLDNNLFIASQSSNKSPDFVIETMDKPILVEVGKGKTKTSQFSSIDNNRYGILISEKLTEISKNNTYIKLPLHWFLLL